MKPSLPELLTAPFLLTDAGMHVHMLHAQPKMQCASQPQRRCGIQEKSTGHMCEVTQHQSAAPTTECRYADHLGHIDSVISWRPGP